MLPAAGFLCKNRVAFLAGSIPAVDSVPIHRGVFRCELFFWISLL